MLIFRLIWSATKQDDQNSKFNMDIGFNDKAEILIRRSNKKHLSNYSQQKKRGQRGKVPQLKLKGKISKEKADKFFKYYSILFAVITGLYLIVYLGLGGTWISPWSWVAGTALAIGWFIFSYR